ncbi:hypothetical protein [Streptomyces lasiicapitis]|nr:hypothetical protein [Streptomyces lasiicapitis]
MHRARVEKTKRHVFAYQIAGEYAEALKRTPLICWKCASAVVSVVGYTKRNGSTYRAQFRLAPSTEHEGTCPLNPTTVITAIAHGAHDLAHVDDSGVLRLTLPKDLTGLPEAPPPGDGTVPGETAGQNITTVRPLLPPLINSAAKVARFLQLHDFDEEIVNRFRVQPHGRKRPIPWGEFCYGPAPTSYARLYELRRAKTPITHPIALYGTVQRIGHEAKSGRPYAVLGADVPAGAGRFDVLLRSAFDTLIKPLGIGMHVLAVGDWDIFAKGRTPQLRLFATEHWQVAYWSLDEETGQVSEPTCPPSVTARQRVIAQTEERARRPKPPKRPAVPRRQPAPRPLGNPPAGVEPFPSPAVAPPPPLSSPPPGNALASPPPGGPVAPHEPSPAKPEEGPASAALAPPANPPRPSRPPQPETRLPPPHPRRRGLGRWFRRRK